MRVTYIGYDYFSPVLLYLLTRQDVTINRVVTETELGGHICNIAQANKLPLHLTRIRKPDLEILAADSDLVLCASYGHRLPIPQISDCRFLNLHPSLLPLGRGPVTPLWTLTRFPETAGISLHVMDNAFDAGAIVSQTSLSAHVGCGLEAYTHHANQAAIALLEDIHFTKLQQLDPVPQDNRLATYQPEFSVADRTILARNSGAEITKLIGALGSLGALVEIAGARYIATHTVAIKGAPAYPAGPFVNDFYGYFPCADGVCLFPKANLVRMAD